MIRVFLADDHAMVVGGLQKLIAETADICVVGTANDGRRALDRLLASDEWDVVILDLSLPRVGGMEVLRRVLEQRPDARILVLSMYPEDQYAVPLIHAGAAGFISKASSPDDLLDAIRRVASGDTYVSEPIGRRLSFGYEADDKPPHLTLTSREHQVFTLLIEGNAVADIAAQLDLTSATISNHVARIRTKLSARTVVDIVRYAHRAGLIDSEGPLNNC